MEAVNTAITAAGADALGVGYTVLGVLAGLVVISYIKGVMGRKGS